MRVGVKHAQMIQIAMNVLILELINVLHAEKDFIYYMMNLKFLMVLV